jgi:hypothetical protein
MRTRFDPGVAGSADGVGGGGSSACVEPAVLRDSSVVVSRLLAAGDDAAIVGWFASCSALANSLPALGSPLVAVTAIINGLDDTRAPAAASSA